MNSSPVDVARALHSALEAGTHGEALREFFTEDAQTIVRPNLLAPRGGTAELEKMLASSTAGADLLVRQRYELVEAGAIGDVAVVRCLWTGTLAKDMGQLRAGHELRAYIAQFVTTRDGRIARIETYDCYEPFAPAA